MAECEIAMSSAKLAHFLLALLFIAAAPLPQAVAASFTIDAVMSAPFASSPLASPTGAKVVWILNEQGRRNLWIASGPEWKGRKLTSFNQDDGQEIDEVVWSPDSNYLLFTRGGDFEMGRDNPNPAMSTEKPDQSIWRADLNGAAVKKLTEGHLPSISPKGDQIVFLRGGQIFTMTPAGDHIANVVITKGRASDLRWSPGGSALAFVDNRPEHSMIAIYKHGDKTLRYLDPSVDRDTQPAWSPDGQRIAYLRIPAMTRAFAFGPEREGYPWSIRLTDFATGASHEVFQAKPGPGSVFHGIDSKQQVNWAPGDRLVFPWEVTGWCHLYSIPSAGGMPVELTPGEGIVEHVALSTDRKSIYFSANFGDIDRRHLWTVGASSEQPPQQITHGENIEWAPTPTADGSGLIFLASSYNEKSHAAVRTATGTIQSLAPGATPSEFPARTLVKPQSVIITAADGMQIHGQLFLPAFHDASARHPALVFFHGGSRRQMLLGFHYMYYYSNAYALNQYFANHGYVVLSVNYRSGIGYGLNFREALHYGATGASEFNDVVGAGLYLKSRADVDPNKIGLWGGSYGGYLTALGLARASDLFAAGVDFHGVHDWNEVIQNFAPNYDPKARAADAALAFESSPLASITSWKSPVLLIQGDDDRNVPFSQTVQLAEALRKQHVYFEQLILPDEIHDFLLHRSWVAAYKASADFFARELLAKQPPSGHALAKPGE
jgi:dipeptidyl aminopeptidase/acylaminoacyl peptidase